MNSRRYIARETIKPKMWQLTLVLNKPREGREESFHGNNVQANRLEDSEQGGVIHTVECFGSVKPRPECSAFYVVQ